jgi:hypothetical protein
VGFEAVTADHHVRRGVGGDAWEFWENLWISGRVRRQLGRLRRQYGTNGFAIK